MPDEDEECTCLQVAIGHGLAMRNPDPDCPAHADESPDDPDYAYDLVRERDWEL